MLIDPAPSIHSAFMRFEFDAVFLDRDLKVLKIVEGIRPFRAHGARHARKVLELAAGEARRRGVQVGDVLALQPPPGDESSPGGNPPESEDERDTRGAAVPGEGGMTSEQTG